MIELKKGDILAAGTEAIVNTVNCVGVMGRGIALQFKKAFPANFKAYAAACKEQAVEPGRMFVFEVGRIGSPRYIINFPTKRHWRGKSSMADIEAGLADLVCVIQRLGIRSIAIPPLGCGLGGLDWTAVRPRIEKALGTLSGVTVVLYEPAGAPPVDRQARADRIPTMTQGRAALVGLMRSYLAGLMDPFITLLEVHKLMYFMQESGEPLRLNYVKAAYGPYAENLRHVLTAIEGHLTSGYADGGDAPDKELTLLPDASDGAVRFLQGHPETQGRFDRVSDLVQGFESPFGLELLSTVHWVATREGAKSVDEVTTATYGWNERKRMFSQDQIRLAYELLGSKGWLGSTAVSVRR